MSGWACGDCGAEYPASVDYCQRPALDHINLAGRREPIYTQTVLATGINPIEDDHYRAKWHTGPHPVLQARYGEDR